MDFGATLCTRHDPACVPCPLQHDCVALQEGRVAELPTPKPGKPLPERQAIMLWAEDRAGNVLLQRRPPTGIWASLWSLPEAADHENARHWFDTHLAGEYDTASPLAAVAHGFTHYRLQIQPLRWRDVALRTQLADNDDLRWVPRDAMRTLGIPAPIRKLLQADTSGERP
jgi:A/G-specific adenine glycosylase